jgi:hypothetical protein
MFSIFALQIKRSIMKKYIVTNAFSLLDKVLVLPFDEIYAEPVRKMMHIYSPKTRKYIGQVSAEKFETLVKQ